MSNKRQILCLLFFISSCAAWGQKNPCNPTGAPYTSLPGDTTITLPSGTTLTFNRCEFFDLRDCIRIVEITNAEDLRREGLDMYDKDGNILLTCGMVSIDFKECGKTCLEIPIKIKIKVRFQDCMGRRGEIPSLYLNTGTGWEKPKNSDSRITTVNNEQYLEFTGPCAMKFNCDLPKKGRKIKFIAPKGNKIQQLRLGINCPLFYYDETSSRPKRRIKFRMLCANPDNIMVQSKQLTSDGEAIDTREVKLGSLEHGKRMVNCQEPKRSFFKKLFSWLSRKPGDLHKKYYLKAE